MFVIHPLGQIIAPRIDLNLTGLILDMGKRGPAHNTPAHHPPRDRRPHRLGLQRLLAACPVPLQQLRRQRVTPKLVAEDPA